MTDKSGVTLGDCAIMRSAIQFFLCFPMLYIAKKNPIRDFPKGKCCLVAMRSLLGTSGFLGITITLMLIPLSLNAILFNLSPFWISILAWIVNKDKMSIVEIVAMVLCFLGVIGITFGGQDKDEQSET